MSASPAPRPSLIHDGKLDHPAVTVELRRCLDTLLPKARLELAYDIRRTGPAAASELENPEILVVFRGHDQDLLLERNAELLKALEHIALRWLWLDPQFYGRVRFDAGGYRAIRIEELKLSARVAADRVRETHAPFRFNAMAARERRILHLVLKEEPGVRTSSEGSGEERQVVVYPADS
jgi:spoIIIJ-associated protein